MWVGGPPIRARRTSTSGTTTTSQPTDETRLSLARFYNRVHVTPPAHRPRPVPLHTRARARTSSPTGHGPRLPHRGSLTCCRRRRRARSDEAAERMDWYAWLCRAGLHPDVAFEYALLFARNELGATDVRHLDHEFLLSMGVAVAKHRLEILKLAKKEASSSSSSHGRAAVAAAITVLPWRATRLLAAAVHRSASSALGRLRASVSRGRDRDRARDRAAAVLATPRLPMLRHRGGRVAHSWSKIASPVAIRGGKLLALPMLTHISKPVVLTNSCADKWRGDGAAVKTLPAPAGSIAACLESRDVCSCDEDEEAEVSDEEVVMHSGEEMPWESMFQDLKPT